MFPIIPKPNGAVTCNENQISVPKAFTINCGEFERWCTDAYYTRTGSQIGGSVWITLKKDPALAAEAYTLSVSEAGVTVTAATETGVVWALATLFQLGLKDGVLPCCTIADSPKQKHRGLMLDCVRHFFPVEAVKAVIEQLSLVKMNVLHWHLTDIEGWRIESKVFPRLHATSPDYYTHQQIREILEYARVRGVEIIPEIDMPGHSTAFLAAYPELSCTGEEVHIGQPTSLILCAGQERTYDFISKLLDEVCALFPSDRFHIGGDEAVKSAWKSCPHCQKKMAEEGLENVEELQGYFTVRLEQMLSQRGKQMVCWNDVLKAKHRPQNMLPQYWTMQHVQSMMEYFATGGEFIYSEMFEFYLDYPHSMNSLSKIYNCKPHIYNVDCSQAPGLVGSEVCLWSEHVYAPEQLYKRLFPRCQALAENAWSRDLDYADFQQRLTAFLPYLDNQGIAYVTADWWDPQGEAKLEDAFAYLQGMFGMISSTAGNADAGKMLEEMGLSTDTIIQMMSMFFTQEEMPIVMERMGAMFR